MYNNNNNNKVYWTWISFITKSISKQIHNKRIEVYGKLETISF